VLSDKAPQISNVRLTTSLIPGSVETAQTIISWKTDKPSTSQVFFGHGDAANLTQSTPLDTSVTQNHVIITTLLHPGTVYKIKAESTDSSHNITDSDPYTVLTPAPAGSIVDLILTNLKGTFGVFSK
jgi:fructose-1,6-bisphosphatase